MIEYIVGIDFGHGETAVWVVPLSEDNSAGIKLQGQSLRLRESNDLETQKIPSVVYYDGSGKHYLSYTGKFGIETGMKGLIATMNQEKKIHYREFIRLILERLLELNKDILKIVDGEPNFLLCMASPTKWDEEEKRAYLNFFNNAISPLNLRFEWIINESDAAYFSHCDNGAVDDRCSLVIDYGSSTIDYTVMRNGRKISHDKWSNKQIGASTIEKIMYQTLETPEGITSDEMICATKSLLQDKGLGEVDPLQILLFYLRNEKESMYQNGENRYYLSYNFKKVTYDHDFVNHRYEFSGDLTVLTEEYRKVIENDLKGLREKLLAINNGQDPDKIILSGGASIMRWFKDLVREIFSCDDVKDDEHPSFVVAKGIALYARKQLEALEKLIEEIKKINFGEIYIKSDIAATKKGISQFIDIPVNEINNSAPLSGSKILDVFCEFIKSLNSQNTVYRDLLQESFDENLNKLIVDKIKIIIQEVFQADIEIEDLSIHLPVIVMDWLEKEFKEGGTWYRTLSNMIKNSSGRWNFTWEIERDKNEASKIAAGVKSRLSNFDFGRRIKYPQEITTHYGDSLKGQAIQIAKDTFFKYQLFKTTFAD